VSGRLRDLVTRDHIVVCVGAGGVGKTTIAAALGLRAAREGRRVLVLTIDPARRLATALGLDCADGVRRVSIGAELWLDVEMLDTRRTLDEVMARHAPDAATLARIRDNPLYRHLGDALSGAHTYMAMEKLYQVVHERPYDLVVLDTPPSATALSFLQAPQRLADALDNPILESLPAFGGAAQGTSRLARRLAHFTGREIFAGMGELVGELAGMFAGFGERARRVADGLRGAQCAFVVVTAPTALAIEEAIAFRRLLEEARFPFAGFVVNGAQPVFGEPPPVDEVLLRLRERPELADAPREALAALAASLSRAVEDAATLGRKERAVLAPLARAARGAFSVEVPRLSHDVHDVAGLMRIADELLGA
jgi:anion-transporting  ArsA/GET3 family ATPase